MNTYIEKSHHVHLTGFKGVAMASLAQCLHDLGKKLSGSDVAEQFVTENILKQTEIQTTVGFDPQNIPKDTDLLIYTAAHQGPNNPEVMWAREHQIQVLSQAEALAELFNQKKGIAVCGVGGKSTTSAMITWIFSKLKMPISFSVGVGSIAGLTKTGQSDFDSEYFVAEADEYVIDPAAGQRGEPITPRFSFLKPHIVVCTFLAFDHPDVYRDFDHTRAVFKEFFLQTKKNGILIINGDQPVLVALTDEVLLERDDLVALTYGVTIGTNFQITSVETEGQISNSEIVRKNKKVLLQMSLAGKHNVMNAAAALLALEVAGVDIQTAALTLSEFHSTARRFEYIGEKHGVLFYDDYAHHPREVGTMIQTIQSMYPESEVYIAFQPHTFSRTKALFKEFVKELGTAQHLVLLPIFASAREQDDPSMSSKVLFEAIKKEFPTLDVTLLESTNDLSTFFTQLKPGSVAITLGAGDIYQVHDKIQ
ncbi:MAG: Mur ligase family protein [Patescibacteria group bacterium]